MRCSLIKSKVYESGSREGYIATLIKLLLKKFKGTDVFQNCFVKAQSIDQRSKLRRRMNRVSFGSKSLDPINSPWANVLAELDHSEEMIFLPYFDLFWRRRSSRSRMVLESWWSILEGHWPDRNACIVDRPLFMLGGVVHTEQLQLPAYPYLIFVIFSCPQQLNR